MEQRRLTEDLPGTGGTIRERMEDFMVVEEPLYEPSGAGDHLYLLVEKRGLPTLDAAARIARALGLSPRSVGYAGLKDARAVAVQTFSVEHVGEAQAREALSDLPGLRLLDARLHGNKLRLGHLRGNRFDLVVRGVRPGAVDDARRILEVLERRGCPNGFGPQRFGNRADNHLVGACLVRRDPQGAIDRMIGADSGDDAADARAAYRQGDLAGALAALPRRLGAERRILDALAAGRPPEQALRTLPHATVRLLVSAYQSHLFNRLLADRLPDLDRLQEGDLAYLHDRGAVFRVDDPAAEQPRADAMEISPSAPLFGTKTLLASGAPGERERALLAEEGLEPSDFRVPGAGSFDGERRPLRIPVDSPTAEAVGEDALRVTFGLPRGAYATAVLAEIMK